MADSPARLRSVGRFGIEPISLMIRRGSVTIASDASTSTVAVPSPLVRKSRPRPSSTVSPARPSGQVKSMVVVRRTEPARRGGADSTEPPGLRPTGTGIAMRPPSPRPPGDAPGLQAGEESGAPRRGAAWRETGTPGAPPQVLRKNVRFWDSADSVPVPGLPRRAAAGDAAPHVRLRPRGVEPDAGAAAGPLAP